MVVPTGYAQSEWVEQVKKIIAAKGDGKDEPEMQDEDEDDAF